MRGGAAAARLAGRQQKGAPRYERALAAPSPGPARAAGHARFAGQKLVVVGGSSGMGRDTAADVVAGGGSAVIIGQDPDRVKEHAHMAGAATRRKQRYAWRPPYL